MKNVFQIRINDLVYKNVISEDLLPVIFQHGLINTCLLKSLSRNMPP